MTIAAVEAVPLAAELREPFRFGHVTRTTSANVVVRVTSDSGLVGYGEACPVPQFTGETQESVVALLEQRVAPFVRGRSALHWRPLLAGLRSRLHGAPCTLAAVDTAVLDLAGKTLGASVAELLGGRFRDEVEVHGSVGWAEDAEEMAAAAAEQSEMFGTLKLYVGRGEPADDLERLRIVRRRIGGGRPLLIDVNGLWSTLDALAAAAVLAELGVVAVEQPVAPDQRAGLAEVTAVYGRLGVGVVADESVQSVHAALEVASHGLARAVNVGVSKLGGCVAAMEVASVATAAGLQVALGSVVELGIATAAGLQLAGALPSLDQPAYLMGPLKYRRQITAPFYLPSGGRVEIPTGPGLGVEVDELAVAALDVRRHRTVGAHAGTDVTADLP